MKIIETILVVFLVAAFVMGVYAVYITISTSIKCNQYGFERAESYIGGNTYCVRVVEHHLEYVPIEELEP